MNITTNRIYKTCKMWALLFILSLIKPPLHNIHERVGLGGAPPLGGMRRSEERRKVQRDVDTISPFDPPTRRVFSYGVTFGKNVKHMGALQSTAGLVVQLLNAGFVSYPGLRAPAGVSAS